MARGNSSTRPPKGRLTNATRASKGFTSATHAAADSKPAVPVELQQRCLNIFRDALDPNDEDAAILQEIKGHLYNRDFSAAFGSEEYLRIYASRWSPSRALGYLQVLADVQEFLLLDGSGASVRQQDGAPLEVASLGGGAGAELVALGGWMSRVLSRSVETKLTVHLVDIANWASIVGDLRKRIVTPPEISKYASEAAKAANKALLAESVFDAHFHQQDILEWSESDLSAFIRNATLVTLMFTLNELYSTNMPKTQRLLSHLTSIMRSNTLLLVVDSPGSYSTVSINGTEKKYPMQWLLDHTLLSASQKSTSGKEEPKWEKVVSDDSRWFRVPLGLQYPIEVENMRYQIHLYKKLGDEAAS